MNNTCGQLTLKRGSGFSLGLFHCVFFILNKGRVVMMLANYFYKLRRRYQYGKLQIIETVEQTTEVDTSVRYCVMIKRDYFVKSATVFKLIDKLNIYLVESSEEMTM